MLITGMDISFGPIRGGGGIDKHGSYYVLCATLKESKVKHEKSVIRRKLSTAFHFTSLHGHLGWERKK